VLIPTGPKETKSTVLSIEKEVIIVIFRRHALLPFDEFLHALQPTMAAMIKRLKVNKGIQIIELAVVKQVEPASCGLFCPTSQHPRSAELLCVGILQSDFSIVKAIPTRHAGCGIRACFISKDCLLTAF
jgi:hypothetical protein